ncbi:unnamed protein product [Blepharisma stoltei]|uniref:Uncharacterized protein n=1 Tax=Blepharisma stoltei TaxID=1481888 RepID=A0AAU9JUY7_9CILI|nr:unnamed protein product [Blepharisma stoltei]
MANKSFQSSNPIQNYNNESDATQSGLIKRRSGLKRHMTYMWESSIPDKWKEIKGEKYFHHVTSSTKSKDTLEFLRKTEKYIEKISKPYQSNISSMATTPKLNKTPSPIPAANNSNDFKRRKELPELRRAKNKSFNKLELVAQRLVENKSIPKLRKNPSFDARMGMTFTDSKPEFLIQYKTHANFQIKINKKIVSEDHNFVKQRKNLAKKLLNFSLSVNSSPKSHLSGIESNFHSNAFSKKSPLLKNKLRLSYA